MDELEVTDLDVEDIEDLLVDCYAYIQESLQRRQPKRVAQVGAALRSRLKPLTQESWVH